MHVCANFQFSGLDHTKEYPLVLHEHVLAPVFLQLTEEDDFRAAGTQSDSTSSRLVQRPDDTRHCVI